MEDFFDELKEYKAEEVKDSDFKPLKGKYVARIARLTHNIGQSQTTGEPYDFYSVNCQVLETIDGDMGNGRYLSKRYQNSPEGLKKLMNDLFTGGIGYDQSSRDAFDISLSGAVDRTINVRAWSWTPDKNMDGTPIPEEDRISRQQVAITKEFKKDKKTTSENTPF